VPCGIVLIDLFIQEDDQELRRGLVVQLGTILSFASGVDVLGGNVLG
jgi:hypothetical protein